MAWTFGIIYVSFIYPLYVFQTKLPNLKKIAYNIVFYIAYYFVSASLLNVLTKKYAINPRLSIFIVLSIMIPIAFLVTRKIFK